MKKLLAFLILLMVGMALFAMPALMEPPISVNTVEDVQFVGDLETVTEIAPAIKAVNLHKYVDYLGL